MTIDYSAIVLADNPVAYSRLGDAPPDSYGADAIDSSPTHHNGKYIGNYPDSFPMGHPSDRAAAENVLRDLQNALSGR